MTKSTSSDFQEIGHDLEGAGLKPALGAQRPDFDRDSTMTPDRGNWTGQLDFLMSMLAYCIGLGNVWRFPYLCFKNGGGAFLVPYAICWILCAVPLFFLEVSMGQYNQRGGVQLWQICPLFKGVGFSSMMISTYSNIYYGVIVVWATFYFISSFATELPWVSCNHYWNDERCFDGRNYNDNDTSLFNLTISQFPLYANATTNTTNITTQTPAQQFWERRVLKTSDDLLSGPEVVWELLLLLILVWIVSYFALWKGITKIKKVIYICAMMPYALLLILLCRAATLPGSLDGVYYYLKPNLTKLQETTVWKDAGTQVFYSYGIGFAVITAMGSYNKFHHNCLRDTLIICVVNACTSLLAGFVVFGVLGYMAKIARKEVGNVVKSGPGLVFLVYPEAVATLKAPQLWSTLFFLMIMILGLDSQVCNIEGVVTGLSDVFPNTFLRYKEKFVLCLSISCFLLGIPFVTRAGRYWLTIVDGWGPSGFTLLITVFLQIIGFSYGYGVDNLYKSLNQMLGYRPSRIWLYMWKALTPATVLILFLFVSIKFEPLEKPGGGIFPTWAQVLGFLITGSSIMAIPTWAIYCVSMQPGHTILQKVRNAMRSEAEPRPSASEADFDSGINGSSELQPYISARP